MREGNKPYFITYKIAYSLSNTHQIEYFAKKNYIDLPLLFHDIGRIYPPENSSINFKDDFLLDIGDKPKYIDHRPYDTPIAGVPLTTRQPAKTCGYRVSQYHTHLSHILRLIPAYLIPKYTKIYMINI